MIKPVILWTDGLLFLLTVLVGAFILYARLRTRPFMLITLI